MAQLIGRFTGQKTVKYTNKKTQEEESFRKGSFIENDGSGKPFEITIPDNFDIKQWEERTIDVAIEQKGFNVSISLK